MRAARTCVLPALLLFFTPAAGEVDHMQDPETRAQDLAVMLRCQLGQEESWGAGIVFGANSSRIYIVTANHVVRGGGAVGTNVQVQFRQLRGEWTRATVLTDFDATLDLAVVTVAIQDLRGYQPTFRFDVVGTPTQLKARDNVFVVGFPNQRPWDMYNFPGAFAEKRGSILRFTSNYIAQGHSGGALFDSEWLLVGLVLKDQPPRAEAITVDAVLESVNGWGYPVNWSSPGRRTEEAAPPEPTVAGLFLRRNGKKGECINSSLIAEAGVALPTLANLAGGCLDVDLPRGTRLSFEHVNIGCGSCPAK